MRISDWSSDVCSSDLSLSRTDSAVARSSLEKAQAPDEEPPTELEQALAQYPDPATSRVGPEDLSLLEAASLIALLRACSLDHVRWTLSPLRDAGNQRFEPTRKFIDRKSTRLNSSH